MSFQIFWLRWVRYKKKYCFADSANIREDTFELQSDPDSICLKWSKNKLLTLKNYLDN